jgi:hypothetical protein
MSFVTGDFARVPFSFGRPGVARPIAIVLMAGWSACGTHSGFSVSGKDAGRSADDSSATGAPVAGEGGSVGGASAAAATGGHGGPGGNQAPSAAGGTSATGGSLSSSSDASPSSDALATVDAGIPGAALVDPNSGYTTVATGTVNMSGYASSAASAGSSISLSCTPTSLCANGAVGVSMGPGTWANVSFAVNQAKTGGSGSTDQLVLVGSSMSISYLNKAGSPLEFQLWDGTNFWCYYLPPSKVPNTVTFPFSSLNTRCWNGQGDAFTSGTPITSVQLVVPGSSTAPTPFDYCLLGLTVQ